MIEWLGYMEVALSLFYPIFLYGLSYFPPLFCHHIKTEKNLQPNAIFLTLTFSLSLSFSFPQLMMNIASV